MEQQYLSKLHPTVDYGAGVFLLIIGILTILGNSAVLATAVKRSSRLKSPELLIINLAVTDLGMAISMYPLAIASAWNHAWLGGDASCIYYALMGFLFGISSMMTLCMMAVIRFLVTNSSTSNSNTINKTAVRISIAFIWLCSLLWAILPLLGWGYYGPEPFGISCTIAWSEFHNSANGFSFILSMFILCTLLPALTILICYLGIAWKVHKAYQEIQNFDRIPNAAKLERRLTLMAVLVSVGFLGAWTPYAAVSFWSIFNSSNSLHPVITLLPCLFAKSSTAYNPFIYYVFSKTFRREIKQMKCCCGSRAHFFNTENSIQNHVSMMWMGRENIRACPTAKANYGEASTQ
ncbi:opsin-5-like [Malaclemys terrapin pileata]|uniref:opsin-5-like n=1 Tax=Malaclemys terrapin pileata TaxID=2991368 RepID=UPI0023A9060F|nr:opsin-5-like [Malaclemys terrapin pileata]